MRWLTNVPDWIKGAIALVIAVVGFIYLPETIYIQPLPIFLVITHKPPFARSCTAGERRQSNCRLNLWVITKHLPIDKGSRFLYSVAIEILQAATRLG